MMLDQGPQPFLEWLEVQPKKREFKCGDSSNCALASYLSEQNLTDWKVGANLYSSPISKPRELPEWAQRFVERHDTRASDSCTAEEATSILRKLIGEAQ